jgi:protein TonB
MKQYLPTEKKNKKIGMGVSIGVHLALFILFMLFAAYNPPFPPNPGIPGIELNFGLTDVGMGDIQKENTTNTENIEDSKPDKSAAEDPVEEIPEEVQPVESTPEAQEVVTTAPIESPHVVDEKKPTPKTVNTPEKVADKSTPTKADTKDVKKDGADGKAGESSKATGGSDGDKNKLGDQGNEKGKVDERALYGPPGEGGGNGPKLSMAGWAWDKIPDKKDPSNEIGFVEFTFKVDDHGHVEWVKTGNKTVSPSVVKFYEDQLRTTTFSPTGANIVNFVGIVRFEIKTR